jgi:hypothetical protein
MKSWAYCATLMIQRGEVTDLSKYPAGGGFAVTDELVRIALK